MQNSQRFLLASGSRYRRQLLKRLIEDFEVAAPNVDESARPHETPEALAIRLATAKALALAGDYPDYWIIGSDQVAVCGRTLFSKPGTYANALQQLRKISGQCLTFYTSVCLLNPHTTSAQTKTDTCQVQFRKLSDRQIDQYLKHEQPYDCAAGFKSEGRGIVLVEKIGGNDPNALIGLPLILLTDLMQDSGLDPFNT